MSAAPPPNNEIAFGEVTRRQPRVLRRPDHDPEFACLTHGSFDSRDLPIFLDLEAADAIERHALSDLDVELGGILLGREGIDPDDQSVFVRIDAYLPATDYRNTQASFTYTHETWGEIHRLKDELYPDLDIVGWFHTHPDFGVFLSGHDRFLHRSFFPEPLQVAYVVDPIRRTRGFFQWREGDLVALSGFRLIAPTHRRVALARFLDDLDIPLELADIHDPDALPDLKALGLSPRLEAELLAMIGTTRRLAVGTPLAASASATPSALLALVAGVSGILLGTLLTLLLAAVSLARDSLDRQADELRTLRAQITQREDQTALLLDAMRQAVDPAKLDQALTSTNARLINQIRQLDLEANVLRRTRLNLDQRLLKLEGDLSKVVTERDELLSELKLARTNLNSLESSLKNADPESLGVANTRLWWAVTGLTGLTLGLTVTTVILYLRRNQRSDSPRVDSPPVEGIHIGDDGIESRTVLPRVRKRLQLNGKGMASFGSVSSRRFRRFVGLVCLRRVGGSRRTIT